MRLPNYRLQPVLDTKIKAREKAQENLAQKRKLLQQEERRLAELEDMLSSLRRIRWEAREDMLGKMRSSISALSARMYADHLKNLAQKEEEVKARICHQKLAVQRAQQEVKAARELLSQAAREEKIMEKHKEQWLQRVKKEMLRREEKELDEIGAATHNVKHYRR